MHWYIQKYRIQNEKLILLSSNDVPHFAFMSPCTRRVVSQNKWSFYNSDSGHVMKID